MTMKSAIGIIFTAALGGALPHDGRSTLSGSSNANAANESKLPWLEHGGNYSQCLEVHMSMSKSSPSRETVEEACGTKYFCETFDPKVLELFKELQDIPEKYGYADHKQCFAAHEPEPISNAQ